MDINKTYPGPKIVSTRFVTDEAIVTGLSPVFGITQPANSLLEKIYVRVLEAPIIATGDISIEVGTETVSPDNIVVNAADKDNLLDGGTTLPPQTIFDLTNSTGSTWAGLGLAAGDTTSENASKLVTQDTQVYFQFETSTAVDTPGKFEVSFVFRVFE